MNIVVPLAGEGKRFKAAGYKEDKPFIRIDGATMIHHVIENLPIGEEDKLILLCRRGHEHRLYKYTDHVIVVDEVTEGSTCTVLLAKKLINNKEELMIANADQIVKYNRGNWELVRSLTKASGDGAIWLFPSDGDRKWSYASLNSKYEVSEVAEKDPISEWATVGVYYWRTGSTFVQYAESMIEQDLRINGEFYNCPVYNEALRVGKVIYPFFVEEMHGLGTPDDLNKYLRTETKNWWTTRFGLPAK